MRTHAQSKHTNRLRIATYNILVGGRERDALIHDVLQRIDADVIALQEVAELPLLRALASSLGMQSMIGEPSEPGSVMRTAILTRRPVRSWRNELHRGRMLRGHLHCEIETGSAELPVASVHCVHLAARFGERANGEARRARELAAITEDVARLPQLPHLLAGDFNALSPGDSLAATRFFRRYNEMRRAGLIVNGPNGYLVRRSRDGEDGAGLDEAWRALGVDPRLQVGIPSLPRAVARLTSSVPVNASLDRFLGRFLQRWTAERLEALGYVDVFRQLHPRARGYTCATWLPAARVDYVFATPDLASRAVRSDVVGSRTWPDPDASVASDHFPLVADFTFE
jgi:endonuclease/exonuclease/phosphatase family metal-dependent hydrolase